MSRKPEDTKTAGNPENAGISEIPEDVETGKNPEDEGLKCYIVRDLLPDYEEGLVGQEVSRKIEDHLWTCLDCQAYRRTLLSQMQAENSAQTHAVPETERKQRIKETGFLRKLKKGKRRKYAFAVLAALAVIAAVSIFLSCFKVVRPYDEKNMTVETYKLAQTVNNYGNTQWTELDQLDAGTTEEVLKGKLDTINFVRLVRRNRTDTEEMDSVGRTISSDGETVRIIYYCYWDSLWNDLTGRGEQPENVCISDGSVSDSMELYEAGHKAIERKIYYLPKANIKSLDRLSDEAFAQMADEAVLVWEGKI